MNQRITKELRLILPASLLGFGVLFLAPLLAISLTQSKNVLGFVSGNNPLVWLYVSLVTALSWGQEFSSNSFSSLMTQPIKRRTLLFEKTLVLVLILIVSLLSLEGIIRICFGKTLPTDFHPWAFIAFAAGMAPLAAFLTRKTYAVFWLALTLMFILLIVADSLSGQPYGEYGVAILSLGPFSGNPVLTVGSVSSRLLAMTGIITFALTLFRLNRIQDIESDSSRLFYFESKKSALAKRTSPQRQLPWCSHLVRKELALQQINLLVFGFCVLVSVFTLLVITQSNQIQYKSTVDIALLGCRFIVSLLPFLIGTVACAQERQFGTATTELLAPVSLRKTWWIKVATSYLLSLLLCGSFQYSMDLFGRYSARLNHFNYEGMIVSGKGLDAVFHFILWPILACSFGLICSTLSKNVIQALTRSLGFCLLAFAIYDLIPNWLISNMAGKPASGFSVLIGLLAVLIAVPELAYRNYYSALENRLRIRKSLRYMLAFGVVGIAVSAFATTRSWELILQPRPSDPEFAKGPFKAVPSHAWTGFGGLFVVAPNQSLWWLKHFYHPSDSIKTFDAKQIGDAKNWIKIGATRSTLYALNVDGELWQIDRSKWPYDSKSEIEGKLIRKIPDHMTDFATNYAILIVIDEDGSLKYWGAPDDPSQIRPDNMGDPTPISQGQKFRQIVSYQNYFVALDTNDQLWEISWVREGIEGSTLDKPRFRWPRLVPNIPPTTAIKSNRALAGQTRDGSYWIEGRFPGWDYRPGHYHSTFETSALTLESLGFERGKAIGPEQLTVITALHYEDPSKSERRTMLEDTLNLASPWALYTLGNLSLTKDGSIWYLPHPRYYEGANLDQMAQTYPLGRLTGGAYLVPERERPLRIGRMDLETGQLAL